MLYQYVAAALVSENKVARPSGVRRLDSRRAQTRRTTSRWARSRHGRRGTSSRNVEQVLALELLVRGAGLDFRTRDGIGPASASRSARPVREAVAHLDADRDPQPDIAAALSSSRRPPGGRPAEANAHDAARRSLVRVAVAATPVLHATCSSIARGCRRLRRDGHGDVSGRRPMQGRRFKCTATTDRHQRDLQVTQTDNTATSASTSGLIRRMMAERGSSTSRDGATFALIPPCADPRFDHRTCDYWEDADRGSKQSRPSWLDRQAARRRAAPKFGAARQPVCAGRPRRADAATRSPAPLALRSRRVRRRRPVRRPLDNPFAPQTQRERPLQDGVPRKLALLDRGRGDVRLVRQGAARRRQPVAYCQFGPLSAYPRARRLRELYPQLPDAPLPAVITCIAIDRQRARNGSRARSRRRSVCRISPGAALRRSRHTRT